MIILLLPLIKATFFIVDKVYLFMEDSMNENLGASSSQKCASNHTFV